MSNSPDYSDYDIPYNKSEDEYDVDENENENDFIDDNKKSIILPLQNAKTETPVKQKLQLKKKSETTETTETTETKETKETTETIKITKPTKPESKKKLDKVDKIDKLEDKFEFDEETINFFAKDLDAKNILIKHKPNSPILNKINDTKVICLLLKLGHFKEYHCTTPKCKVGKIWIENPIQLILNRKNNSQTDLSIINLELICANCFMIKCGLDIFIKKKADIILNCSICNFPLVKFKNGRKAKGLCLACEKQMSAFSYEKQEDEFCNKLQNRYSDNPVLSDDIKHTQHTQYYSDSSKYKQYDSSSNASSNASSKKKNKDTPSVALQQPLIEVNMSMPNLFDLLGSF